MELIEKLVADILPDEYFNTLLEKCIMITAGNIFKQELAIDLSAKDLRDLLRFADILSNSTNSNARNKAYQIISALNHNYSSNQLYRTLSKAVFSKLGNFPAINYLESKNDNFAKLPLIREIETESKRLIQRAPDSNGMIFTDTQYSLFEQLSNSVEFSFAGPTSMGKSFIIKSFIKKVIKNSPPENIVITVPTRALINQFLSDLKSDLGELLDLYHYKVYINSNISAFLNEEKHHYILILTPERLLSYLAQEDSPPIGFLFVDEAHKLASDKDSRSITTYSAIAKAQKRYGNIKLYFSSPNVSNPEVFLSLFKRNKENSFKTNESPVSQNIYFVDLEKKEVEIFTDQKSTKVDLLLDSKSQLSVSDFIAHIGEHRNNLIYCNSKRNTIDQARDFSENIVSGAISIEVQQAIDHIKDYIHPAYYLVDLLAKGVAYHYGKLPQLIRNLVEDLYKDESIRYIFCTSTLLEGINMPTQNIFILDNRNGRRSPLSQIDFWNLSGRAGRLSRELQGNIFCIQHKDFNWESKDMLIKKEITLNPTVLTKVDRNLQKIEKILQEKNISGTETEKEILGYIANIIKVDTLETNSTYRSPIIDRLIDKNKEKIIQLAESKVKNYSVPTAILSYNQTIDFTIQDEVFKKVKTDGKSILPSANQINYENCLKVLETFHHMYCWESKEKKLSNPNSLRYYAVLMNKWIHGLSLSQIISQSITWHDEGNHQIKVDYNKYELFDKSNKWHINILIESIIDDIEYILQYVLEKYFNHYYQTLVSILGEAKAGENWSALLEYGTQNPLVIALQNIGLSRNTAIKVNRLHRDTLQIADKKLVGIDKFLLLERFAKRTLEYEELKRVL